MRRIVVLLVIALFLCGSVFAESAPDQNGIVGDYDPAMIQITETYQMDINGSAFYYFVVKNVAGYDLGLCMEVDAIGQDGEVLDSTKEWEHAVSPDAEIVLIPRFVQLPLEQISTIKFKIESQKAESYYGVNSQMDISYEQINNGIKIKMTNIGSTPVKYPQAYVLFFRDGELIDFDGTALFYGNGSSTLDAGMSEEREAHCYKIYDDVKVFTSGEWE